MQVKELMKQLQELDPNEEVVVMYWAKQLFDDYEDEDNAISVDTWNEVVDKLDNGYLDNASSDVHEIIEDTLRELMN